MKKFPLVDILRGFAALLVVFYHVIEVSKWTSFPFSGLALLPRFGWIGVDLFFVISGFVIGLTAMGDACGGEAWRWRYMRRRLRRILPLYLATMACYLFFVHPHMLAQGWMSVRHVGSHLLFLHNLSPITYGSVNGPSWSIALEMQFYVLMVLTAARMARMSWPKVLMVWFCVSLGWRFASTLLLPPGSSNTDLQMMLATQLPGVMDQFACGICLAKLVRDGKLAYRPARLLGWGAVAVGLLTLAALTLRAFATYWDYAGMIIFWRTLLSAGFAALLACFILVPVAGGWATRPLRYLGEISYGIYLWHFPILLTLVEKTQLRGLDLLFTTVACTLVMAALSWHGLERLWLVRRIHQPRVS
jgi:peptidoglycan/LPS O-acetylase OafA/YrhL